MFGHITLLVRMLPMVSLQLLYLAILTALQTYWSQLHCLLESMFILITWIKRTWMKGKGRVLTFFRLEKRVASHDIKSVAAEGNRLYVCACFLFIKREVNWRTASWLNVSVFYGWISFLIPAILQSVEDDFSMAPAWVRLLCKSQDERPWQKEYEKERGRDRVWQGTEKQEDYFKQSNERVRQNDRSL